MDVLKKIAKNWRNFPEPVQLIYVITFSICIVPKDKIYIDKVISLVIYTQLLDSRSIFLTTNNIVAHLSFT